MLAQFYRANNTSSNRHRKYKLIVNICRDIKENYIEKSLLSLAPEFFKH